MNITILDSWLRDYVKTKATPKQIAEKLSLTSVSVERLEKHGKDFLYEIEITTNRPDLMSIVGLARETATVLSQNGIQATFTPPKLTAPQTPKNPVKITIKNNDKLVNRICAVVLEVNLKQSPKEIQERLETTDIRSLNNIIDVTNYVMRVIGHPTHAFDYDRLAGQTLIVRESKPKEKIQTLDKKEYSLPGGDIVAEDGKGTIVDLFGIMGLENSVVTNETKRILFFLDNNDPHRIRKTSMTLGIRTEAAQINEKALDPELAWEALLYGIKLYEQLADGKVVSNLIDIYPNKEKRKTITVSEQHINQVIGVSIPLKQSVQILKGLGFDAAIKETTIVVTPPSFRTKDMEIPEDIIEEIARVYGYHNIPNTLPPFTSAEPYRQGENGFYWEDRVKEALAYWGFTEVYTYPMVSNELYDGPIAEAVTIHNPLTEDFVHMRRTLVPSLLKVVQENKNHESISIFEIANVYHKKTKDLPAQFPKLALVTKKPKNSFFAMKGVIEQLLTNIGITDVIWKEHTDGNNGASILLNKTHLGDIVILDRETITTELDFSQLLKHATIKKTYKPLSKYPPSVEDLALIAPTNVKTGEIIELIKKQSTLIADVSLFDKYQETRTFHVVYQSYEKNLTSEGVGEIREKVLKALQEKLNAKLKE